VGAAGAASSRQGGSLGVASQPACKPTTAASASAQQTYFQDSKPSPASQPCPSCSAPSCWGSTAASSRTPRRFPPCGGTAWCRRSGRVSPTRQAGSDYAYDMVTVIPNITHTDHPPHTTTITTIATTDRTPHQRHRDGPYQSRGAPGDGRTGPLAAAGLHGPARRGRELGGEDGGYV
jgi:hypothetical protein